MSKSKSTPAPLETQDGKQKDDNIDDLGHRPDGREQDQPTKPERETQNRSNQKR